MTFVVTYIAYMLYLLRMIIYRRRHPLYRFFRQTFYRLYNWFKKLYWRFFKTDTEGVKIMVFNSKNDILLVRIGYMKKYWVIPGGKLERGESREYAARRELFEEIGVSVGASEFAFKLEHQEQYKKDTVHYFVAKSEVDQFVIDDEEIIDVGWFKTDILPEKRTLRIDKALEMYNNWKSKRTL